VSLESKVISACIKSRESYDLIYPLLERGVLSDTGNIVFELLTEYYEADSEAVEADVDTIRNRAARRFPKQADYLTHVIENISEVSCKNVEKDFLDMRKESLRQELSSAFMSGDEEEIENKLHDYSVLQEISIGEEDNVYMGEDIDNVLSLYDPANMVPIIPRDLNEYIGGGVPKSSHVIVYARSETGKSMFCINAACGFINRGEKVLFIENEDAPRMTLARFICRLSNKTLQEVKDSPRESKEIADRKGYNNLVVAALNPGSVKEVERLVKKHEPDVLVVNQLHNLSHKNDNKVERLEILAKEIRDLINRYEMVGISVTQAGESAHNKLVLEMPDIYYSTTGIQTQADLMIGIGMDEEADRLNYRFLSICKNKLNGQHGAVKVRVDPQRSKVYNFD